MVRKTWQPALRQPRHRNHRPPDPPWRPAGNYGIGVVSKVTSSFLLVCRRVVVHWRAIVLLLILASVAFLVARSDEFGRFELILLALLLIFIASQIFWIRRLIDIEEWLIPGRLRRVWLAIMTVVVYLFVFLYSYPEWGLGHT